MQWSPTVANLEVVNTVLLIALASIAEHPTIAKLHLYTPHTLGGELRDAAWTTP